MDSYGCIYYILLDPDWVAQILGEFKALVSNSMWELVPRLLEHKMLTCK